MKYFSACGPSFDLLRSFWVSQVDEGLYFVAEFRTDYSFDNEFIEKSINRLASFTNLLADDGKADQRRTIGSALPLDSIRRLIQRAVIRFLYAANG